MPVPAAVAALALACAESSGQVSRTGQECAPIDTRAAGTDHSPAFLGQTRACGIDSEVAFEVTVVAGGFEHPWSVEPLPGGGFLVTERPGRLRHVSAGGDVGPPVAGVPEVSARRQGGLLDVALDPEFDRNRRIFWSYAEPRDGGNATSVASGILSEDHQRLSDVQVIVRSLPTYDGTHHYGSRLAFGPDDMLYVTLGERSDRDVRSQAQDLDSHLGKILRVRPDGSAPPDNPFVGEARALPEIWSLGHRNVQAATFDADGRLWEIEHGPKGGDELNLVEPGVNYGWPIQTYGEEYSGRAIRGAAPRRDGIRQPVYYWDPVIAPSGAEWYTGDAFPAWRGSLFVGALRQARLVRLELTSTADGWRVSGEEHLLVDRRKRVRDVRQGPDGALYVVTDESDGELWRIAPPGE